MFNDVDWCLLAIGYKPAATCTHSDILFVTPVKQVCKDNQLLRQQHAHALQIFVCEM